MRIYRNSVATVRVRTDSNKPLLWLNMRLVDCLNFENSLPNLYTNPQTTGGNLQLKVFKYNL